MRIYFITLFIPLLLIGNIFSQGIPSPEENIPFLVTFGNKAKKSYGDDDNCQVFFFSIPKEYKKPFYIRIFDPEIGGENDEIVKIEDTETTFELFGGKGTISEKDARQTDPTGNFKSGNLIQKVSFKNENEYDNKWYTIGPLDPSQGEYSEIYMGNIFKLVCEGVSGDDGNLYKYFLSTSATENIPIPGGNAFTFEYTIRLHSGLNQISHVYPFVDEKVISIRQTNFDLDNDGTLELSSVGAKGFHLKISGDNEFIESEYKVLAREKGTSLDIQFIKGDKKINNNNVVIHVTNQYGEALPFFAVPIGGIPKYKGLISVKPQKR